MLGHRDALVLCPHPSACDHSPSHSQHPSPTPAVTEMSWCFADARDDPQVGVVILTGEGSEAFCSGGDQSVRGKGGYVGTDRIPRLNVLDLQIQVRYA